jgi:hypothetical protein
MFKALGLKTPSLTIPLKFRPEEHQRVIEALTVEFPRLSVEKLLMKLKRMKPAIRSDEFNCTWPATPQLSNK